MLAALLSACSGSNASLDRSLVDLKTLERPTSPNTYLVCPEGYSSAQPDAVAPIYPVSVTDLEKSWIDGLANAPRTEQLNADPEGHRYLYVQRTPTIGFPDLIRIDFLPAEPTGSTLCIYSRSIYGHSDMGTNKARVEEWLERYAPAPASADG